MKNLPSSVFTVQELIAQFNKRMKSVLLKHKLPKGISTGYYDLDNVLGGFETETLYVIAARPLTGKTAFMINLVYNIILDPVHPSKVVLFTSDLSARLIMNRLISCASDVWLEKIERGKVEEQEGYRIKEIISTKLSSTPLIIDESPILTISSLDEKCTAFANGPGIDIVFIDALQFIAEESGHYKDEKIALIMQELKSLAKKYSIPIILITELKPEEGKGSMNKPQLSDLRQIGPIEHEADIMILLFKDNYYDDKDSELADRSFEIIWASIIKNRKRSLESVRFKAMLYKQKFIEFPYDYEYDFPKTVE